MKKFIFISSIITAIILFVSIANSCKTPAAIVAKSGAQIWGENCVRCHNAPSPETFSDGEWDVAGTHMQIRANLTPEEAKKVGAFLQLAN